VFLRFITQYINGNSETETGIFNAMRFVRDNPLTNENDAIKLTEIYSWFDKYLQAPDKFSNAKNNNPAAVSLSWFKDTANVDIRKMYEAKEILFKYDILVEVINTRNPGYIVYEDNQQVSAIPFKTDKKKST
jgi:hypothetical protein